MRQFNEFALSPRLQNILASLNYISPTKIQEKIIPLIMDGKDILASSQTGSGKTGAFLVPLIAMIEADPTKNALIIAPTRELAKQIYTVANQMLSNASTLLIGGEDISRQIRQLKKGQKIVIGTPGRINDHLLRRSLCLKKTHFLVLDETDRMLDMGFGVQINKIITHLPAKRQTILLSATLPKSIIKLSEKYLNNPAHITVGNPNAISTNITQNVIHTEEKFDVLVKELDKISGSVLIFVRTQRNAEKMKIKLKPYKHRMEILHGGLRQGVRTRVMKAFRDGDCDILVATDVASRGLDVPHIEHVINYDLPDSPDDYIHRIGRTARADKTGIALSLISSCDKQKWKSIQRMQEGKEEEAPFHNRPKKARSKVFKNSKSFKGFQKTKFNFKGERSERSFKGERSERSDTPKAFRERRFAWSNERPEPKSRSTQRRERPLERDTGTQSPRPKKIFTRPAAGFGKDFLKDEGFSTRNQKRTSAGNKSTRSFFKGKAHGTFKNKPKRYNAKFG